MNESWEDGEGQRRYGTKVKLERGYFVSSGTTRKAPAKITPKPNRQGERTTSSASLKEEFPPEENLPF